ncbi:MAG TPA: ribbon-helix-helix domain-containing protein [Thermoanaerobaculia bacterium]|jgi:metal-responsive CopG/Arc/MetJ family transcriptional regulator|nr:ribbon-helix-helix domain-containing protein [Thermoanaerobaculia bacterium]
MGSAKIAISLDRKDLLRLDRLVASGAAASRSKLIQVALQEKLGRLDRALLARECSKLDPIAEQALAEEGLAEDLATWPPY